MTGLPDAVRKRIPPKTTSAGLSSSESWSLSSSQLSSPLSCRRSLMSFWYLRNILYDASLSLRRFVSLWKCLSSTLPTVPSRWITLPCYLNRRQKSSNEGMNNWISQRELSSLSLTSVRILPTKKGPLRRESTNMFAFHYHYTMSFK